MAFNYDPIMGNGHVLKFMLSMENIKKIILISVIKNVMKFKILKVS